MTIDVHQRYRREKLRSFLKALRRRLDPNSTTIAEHKRINSRRGRRISQEEIAKAAGITRGWYARLESGKPIHASVSLLNRVAVALKATSEERAILFILAIPELAAVLNIPQDRAAP